MNFELPPDDEQDKIRARQLILRKELIDRTDELCTGLLDNPVLKEIIFACLRDCPTNWATVMIRATDEHGDTLHIDAYYVKQK